MIRFLHRLINTNNTSTKAIFQCRIVKGIMKYLQMRYDKELHKKLQKNQIHEISYGKTMIH